MSGYTLGREHITLGGSSVALCGAVCRTPRPDRKVPRCNWCALVQRICSMPRAERGQRGAQAYGTPPSVRYGSQKTTTQIPKLVLHSQTR